MHLAGRLSVRARVLESVRSGRSVLVVGPSGSGRTHLLEDVVDRRAAEAGAVVLVRGGDAEAAVPLAAFAGVVAHHGLAGSDALGIYTRLPEAIARRRTLVAVDDAATLDRASAVLLGQILRAGGQVLVTGESVDDLPRSVRDELRQRDALAVELPLLTTDDVLALAADRLGEELSSASAARLLALAEGCPALVVDLLDGVAVDADRTGVHLPLLRPGPRAREIVGARLDIGPEARDVLVTVALTGEVPTDLFDPRPVAVLREAGLVAGSGTLVPARPLDTLVLVEGVADEEVASRRRAMGARLRKIDGWHARADLLTLRGGGAVPAAELLRSAEQLLGEDHADDAAELLDAAGVVADPGVRLLRGRVASVRGDIDVAARELEAFAAAVTDDVGLRRVGQELGMLHAVRRMDPATAVTAVESVLARVVDGAERRVLEADLVKWRLMAGQAVDFSPSQPSQDSRARLTEAVIGAMVASMDGSAATAEHEVEAGRALLPEVPDAEPWVGELLTLSSYLGTVFDGRVVEGEVLATARRGAAAAAGAPSLGMWEYASAEMALHRGEVHQASSLARRAVRHLSWRDFTGLGPTARALAAAVDARSGRLSAAQVQVDSFEPAQLADVKVGLHVARVTAERLLRDGDAEAAAQCLEDVAELAVAQMHRHLGIMALDEAFMIFPSVSRRDRLVTVSDGAGLGGLLATRAQLMLGGEASEVAPQVEVLRALGLVGRAAHLAFVVSRRFAGCGDDEQAAAWRSRAVVLAADRGALRWPMVEDVQALTARELDVARMAAARSRSREIAERLGLSVRTVDNHLARIYRKLGVSGRDELAAVFTEELADPSPA